MHQQFKDSYKLLLITSSGGGGLLKAADAQEQEVLDMNPNVKIFRRDVLRDWVWSWLGHFSIQAWNRAQKKGSVFSQRFFVSCHWLFDYITWPSIFFHTLAILMKEDIDRVIDTQTTSMKAVIKAIRIFNWMRSKDVFLEKLVVDLPTRKATHFFRPVKALSRREKKLLRLRTIAPLLEDGQTREMFWQSHCGLPDSAVIYEDVNVRRSFRALQSVPRDKGRETDLSFRFSCADEFHLMKQSFSRGALSYREEKNQVTFTIPRDTKVVTILLGSQPAGNATLNYVKNFLQMARDLQKESISIALFVFGGEFHSDQMGLLHRIVEFVRDVEDYPKGFTVVPFAFQEDDRIAPLFHRSDITCSRSGGQTAMELMAVSTGEIWIHSESKKENPNLKELLKGIPKWESESALYLHKLNNAKIVTPFTFPRYAVQFLMMK